jgi:DNA-binding transcriptional LysR family regulator
METFAGMRLFAEVVDSGSFSAAGRRLGLAASSVARAIGTLENQLGVRLLNRTTRKLGLTEAAACTTSAPSGSWPRSRRHACR